MLIVGSLTVSTDKFAPIAQQKERGFCKPLGSVKHKKHCEFNWFAPLPSTRSLVIHTMDPSSFDKPELIDMIDPRMYSVLEIREVVEYLRLYVAEERENLERGQRVERDLLVSIDTLKAEVLQQQNADMQIMRWEERTMELNDILVETECETSVMRRIIQKNMLAMRKMKMILGARLRSNASAFSDNSSISTKQSMELEREASTRSMTSGDSSLKEAIALGPAAA